MSHDQDVTDFHCELQDDGQLLLTMEEEQRDAERAEDVRFQVRHATGLGRFVRTFEAARIIAKQMLEQKRRRVTITRMTIERWERRQAKTEKAYQ